MDGILVAMLDAMMALKEIWLAEKMDVVKAERLVLPKVEMMVSEKGYSKEILMA